MRGADHLVETLANAGITRIFSLSGNQIMPIYDACIDAGIEIIHTRHEAAAVFMADAHAQLTGEVGIALVTAAPGAANAMGALYTVRQSESPVVLLTGDSSRSQDGTGAFQELDQVAMSAPMTKLSFRAEDAAGIGADMARAMAVAAAGRPGPVHLVLPFDVVNATAETGGVAEAVAARPVPVLTELQDGLAKAARPVVLTGPALSATRASAVLARVEAAGHAPILCLESPRGLRDPSLGNLAGVIAEADMIVCLGKRVDFTLGFGRSAAPALGWWIVDAEAEALEMAARNLGDKLVWRAQADPRAVADALVPTPPLDRAARSDWRARVGALIAEGPTVSAPERAGEITSPILTDAVARVMDAAGPKLVFISDGGEFGQWAQASVTPPERIINGPSGAIGGGLCYAIAASKARPDAAVFALMGDGTVGFHFAEFETAAREGTAFVAVIGNDNCWNAEHQIQMRDYGADRLIGCDLSDARYDQAAAALGAHGEYVTDAADLDAALTRALASGRPACVNVRITGLPAPTVS